ncbi:hypothetical protein EON82_08385 [bacterium]|nr:MAG: hypothetical protein EON82_08385 [bacterium]
MRNVMTRVLPDPAPAKMSIGPPGWTTASRCSGFRESRSRGSMGNPYCGISTGRTRRLSSTLLRMNGAAGLVTTESLAAMLALIGAVIAVSALLSGLVERSNFPQVAVFLLLGAVLGPAGLGVLHVGLDSPVLRVVATLSLALVLFTDALSLNLREVRKNLTLAGAILGPGTLLATAAMGFAGHYILGLSPALAAILAAALASTDPVLLRGLLRRPHLPSSARLSLRLESGLNDVVLLPVVLVAMTFAAPSSEGGVSVPKLLMQMLVLGPGAGVAVAAVSVWTLDYVRKNVGIRRDYESIYSLGVCLAAFAAAEALHGSGFLAAFAAGVTISALDVELCDCFQEYGETTAELLLLFTFVLLGASLIWSGLSLLGSALVAFLVLALAARPLSLMLTLKPLRIDDRSRAIIAWFGPRGLSTLLLVLVPVFGGTPGADRLFQYASVVVLFSVAIHGVSIMAFGSKRFQGATEPEAVVESPESVTAEQVRAWMDGGEYVQLADVRSTSAFADSDLVLPNSVRLDLGRPEVDAERHGFPKEAWIALYCTCPNEKTSLAAADRLRRRGWLRAVAVVGGWDALVAAGFEPVTKSGVNATSAAPA